MTKTQLIIIKPNDTYKGVDNMEIETVFNEDKQKTLYNIHDQIASTTFMNKTHKGNPHPFIVLTKTETNTTNQMVLADDLYCRYRKRRVMSRKTKNNHDWIHLVINSKNNCIKIFTDLTLYKVDKSFAEVVEDICINKLQSELSDDELDLVEDDDYEPYYISKDTTISEMLQILKLNLQSMGIVAQRQCIINIIGGHCLARGVSIVDTDYEYHINGEILIPSSTMDCGSIMQGLRLCGVFKDNIQPKLWTTDNVRDHIVGYNNLQEKMLEYLDENEMECVEDMLEVLMLEGEEALIKRKIGRGVDGKLKKLNKTKHTSGDHQVYEDGYETTKTASRSSPIVKLEQCK